MGPANVADAVGQQAREYDVPLAETSDEVVLEKKMPQGTQRQHSCISRVSHSCSEDIAVSINIIYPSRKCRASGPCAATSARRCIPSIGG